jgi:hypothetical protein
MRGKLDREVDEEEEEEATKEEEAEAEEEEEEEHSNSFATEDRVVLGIIGVVRGII